jgi:hypothetical protein
VIVLDGVDLFLHLRTPCLVLLCLGECSRLTSTNDELKFLLHPPRLTTSAQWKNLLCLPWHEQVVVDDAVYPSVANRGFVVKRIQPVLVVFNRRSELRRLSFHRWWSARVWQWRAYPGDGGSTPSSGTPPSTSSADGCAVMYQTVNSHCTVESQRRLPPMLTPILCSCRR